MTQQADRLPLTAGTVDPLTASGMRAILQRYLPQVHESDTKAAPLRKRVLDGETQISRLRSMINQHIPTDVTEADLADAEQRLDKLRLELRQYDAWAVVGLGMALAEGVAAILSDVGRKEGWQPPEGSILRIVMPGLLSLAIDLHDQSYVKSNL